MTKTEAREMRRSWLVQRLNKPRQSSGIFGKDNPFAFGGGLRNGGLSDDAMNLLRPIFSFDYMGSAEFEFGKVPETLSGLAKNAKRLTAASVTFPLSVVPPSWRTPKDAPQPTGDAEVFILCRKADLVQVQERIKFLAAHPYGQTKESTNLGDTLLPTEEWHGETQGWLELDNGFIFFTDRVMWAQTCAVFGVKVPAVSR